MNTRWCWVLGSIATAIWSVSLSAQNGPLLYTLIDGSQLIDDCPICDRPTIAVPMRGTFELRLDQVGPLSSLYAIENIHFKAGIPNGPSYTVQGTGIYRITGEVAVTETITLEVQIDNGFTNFLCFFTNAPGSIARFWPMVRSMPSSIRRATSVQPINSNIITPESMTEAGLMTSLSAYFGAVPCVASKQP